MRRSVTMIAIALVAGSFATAASAQTPAAAPSGPAYSKKFFTTALEKDPSRVVQMQMQLHLPNRPGNGFHTHNGDQWEAVIEGEITYTVKGQPPQGAQGRQFRLHPARHHPSQREQERRAGAHRRAPDHGQGQAAEQSGADRLTGARVLTCQHLQAAGGAKPAAAVAWFGPQNVTM